MTKGRRAARRLGAIALIALFGLAPLGGASAVEPRTPETVIASGAGLAAAAVAIANVDPDFDIWPLYSESSFDNQSSHGLSGAIWPGFLLDAFAWLYGLQPQERGGLGISESQWPNPPHETRASSTGFMIQNFADGCGAFFGPEECAQAFEAFGDPPLAAGLSDSKSGELTSSGSARGAHFDIPGLVEATEATSRTATRFGNGRALVESIFTARDVDIGSDVHIELIEARSVAEAGGDRDASDAKSTLRIVGARFGDNPITIDDQGVHIRGEESSAELNAVLAGQGLEIRASQGRRDVDASGESVRSATGGLLVRVHRERVEEDVPEPLVAGKNAACASAEDNPLNQEITRIRVDQPNPLYGQLPIPGMPERAQVEQSVPPPMSCPFFNRNFDMTIGLGLTNASARLSPLPEATDLGVDIGTPISFGRDEFTTRTRTIRLPGASVSLAPVGLDTDEGTGLGSARPAGEDAVRRLEVLYGVIALGAALTVAGRFALRAISAP